jgi:RNA polymerase sigma-70 factor, ECF subfamily
VVSVIQQEQFLAFVNQYQRLIFTICLSFTKNSFDAEDLAQETFLSAYRSLDAFDGKNPKAWLAAIAANKCRDCLKSPARKAETLTEEEWCLVENGGGTPEDELIDKDAATAVRALCDRLKEPYRTTATKYFCDGVKLSELSQDTGQNLKTLETQLYRAKKLLKVLWKEESA